MHILHIRTRFGACLLLAGLVACVADDDPPLPDFEAHPVTVAPARQWAGDTVALSSAAFRDWPGEEFPLVVGDAELVTAHRTSDSTFSATLPDTLPGGHYHLRVATVEYANFDAVLDVAGWTDTRSVAITGTNFFSIAWPADAPTGLLLVQDDTLRFIRAATGAIVTFPATTTTWISPLGMDGAGKVVARLNGSTVLGWNLNLALGTATATDTFAMGVVDYLTVTRLPGGGWLYTGHDWIDFSPGAYLPSSYVTAPRPVVSAGAGRVVVPYRVLTPDPGGIPIFGTDSGTIRALVPDYSRLDAATFNPAGTVLYLAVGIGGLSSPSQSLLRLDPLTGAVLDSVAAIPNPRAEDLALDETHGWLFEAVRDSTRWTLRIRDAETLALVAQLRSPTTTDGCRQEGELHLLPAPGSDAVYLGSAGCSSAGAEVGFARFTLK